MPQAPPVSALGARSPTTTTPGIYGYGHTPRPAPDPERAPGRRLIGGALLALLSGLLVWSLCWNGYSAVLDLAVIWFTPDDSARPGDAVAFAVASNIYYVLFALPPRLRLRPARPLARALAPLARPALSGLWDEPPPRRRPGGRRDPTPCVARVAGGPAARARRPAHRRGPHRPDERRRLRADPAARGPACGPTPPGWTPSPTPCCGRAPRPAATRPATRDLPHRGSPHDLLAGQVRIGLGADDDRNPYQHRGSGSRSTPTLLGTGLLAVGPPGSGKTRQLVRPVVESLCLQALDRAGRGRRRRRRGRRPRTGRTPTTS